MGSDRAFSRLPGFALLAPAPTEEEKGWGRYPPWICTHCSASRWTPVHMCKPTRVLDAHLRPTHLPHLETQEHNPHSRSPPATGLPVSRDQRGPPHTRTSARTKWWPHSFSRASWAGAWASASARAGPSSTSAQGSRRGSMVAGGARGLYCTPPL